MGSSLGMNPEEWSKLQLQTIVEDQLESSEDPIDAGLSSTSTTDAKSDEAGQATSNSSSSTSSKDEALPPYYSSSAITPPVSGGALTSPSLSQPHCTACKGVADLPAVANCFTCAAHLCASCVIAHQLMVAFEGHHVTNLGNLHSPSQALGKDLEVGSVDNVRKMVIDSRKKVDDLRKLQKSIEYTSSRLSSQYEKAMEEVGETFSFYTNMISERKTQVVQELEKVFSNKQVSLSHHGQQAQESLDSLEQTVIFMEKLLNSASTRDIIMFQSSLETRLASLAGALPPMDLANASQLEFISNYQAIQVGVKNQFGYVKSGADVDVKQPPIKRPIVPHTPINAVTTFGCPQQFKAINSVMSGLNKTSESDLQNNFLKASSFYGMPSTYVPTLPSVPAPASLSPPSQSVFVPLTPSSSSSPIAYPPKAQIKRQKMIYHCKFGEFGILEGQFTEPSGVAVTEKNEIVVADTNNHRIQVFDKDGNFKFQFGEVGKRDGQLLYPNRVAIVAGSGDVVVTERSPTHQVQIFTKHGTFVRKFGADVLQHPRGVAVDQWGRIVVVECKVMRVVIFDMLGNVLNKFSCSRYLEFPNGVVVNDKMEIFVSDNRAHCVKVFDYSGNYLRQIGGEGISNFPIGVGITATGEIAIADNHNNFNLTVFNQAGQLLGALESKVKHAQCFDVALMKDGSIVLASKDYRLYIYNYVKIPNLPM